MTKTLSALFLSATLAFLPAGGHAAYCTYPEEDFRVVVPQAEEPSSSNYVCIPPIEDECGASMLGWGAGLAAAILIIAGVISTSNSSSSSTTNGTTSTTTSN